MAFWRKYIVLRDKRSTTARGYVRLNLSGRQIQVYASAPLKQGKYTLLLFGRGFTQRMYMNMYGKYAVASGAVLLPRNERILAAVMSGGKMLLLGESDGVLSDWKDIEQDAANRIAPRRKEGAAKRSAPAASTAAHMVETEPVVERVIAHKMPEPAVERQAPIAIEAEPAIEPMDYEAPEKAEATTTQPLRKAMPDIPIRIEMDELEAADMAQEQAASQEQLPEDDALEESLPVEDLTIASTEEAEQEPRDEPIAAPVKEAPMEQGARVEAPPVPKLDIQHVAAFARGTVPAIAGEYEDMWEWESISVPGSGYTYLMGRVEKDGETLAVAVAVPGEYAPSPPPNLVGFSSYSSGYWVMAQDAAGAALNIRPKVS